MILLTKIITDNWIKTTWQDYVEAIADPSFSKAKGYFFHNQMRIETMPAGFAHAQVHVLFLAIVTVFAALKGIDMNGLDNCSFRKIGFAKCQPDISYYIGDRAQSVPQDAAIINLDLYPVPDLVIEIASSSLSDDKGKKRLLYESLGISEYWIVDVQNLQIFAFAAVRIPKVIANGGSYQIRSSQVLKGLEISLLEETLQQSQTTSQSQVIQTLISRWQIDK